MLIEYAATDMGFLDDYSDADPNNKSIRGNGIVYKPKTDTPRTKKTKDDENAYKLSPNYGGESSGLHQHMISVVVFYYSETLKIMLIEYAATEMDFLDDYSDADPNNKSIRGNGADSV